MDLNDYQNAARRTAVYAEPHRVIYPALGLASEAGEVAGKIKKVLRDQDGDFAQAPTDALKDELGDTLWYIAVLAADLGLCLEDIAARRRRRRSLNKRLPILAREREGGRTQRHRVSSPKARAVSDVCVRALTRLRRGTA